MTRTERIKARQLAQCKFLPSSFDKRFCRALAWSADHDSVRPLTSRQKYILDVMVYRYRRQLAGRLPDDMMIDACPMKSDYSVTDETKTVDDLFGAPPSPPRERPDDPAYNDY